MDEMLLLQRAIEVMASEEFKSVGGGGVLGTLFVSIWEHLLDVPLAALAAQPGCGWVNALRFSQYSSSTRYFVSCMSVTLVSFVVMIFTGAPLAWTSLLSAITVAITIHQVVKRNKIEEEQAPVVEAPKPVVNTNQTVPLAHNPENGIRVPGPKLPHVNGKLKS